MSEQDQEQAGSTVSGALVGWERRGSQHGVVIKLQIVESAAQYQDHRYHMVSVALNARQLRSLARDLARAARSRGLELRPPAPWYKKLWLRLKAAALG